MLFHGSNMIAIGGSFCGSSSATRDIGRKQPQACPVEILYGSSSLPVTLFSPSFLHMMGQIAACLSYRRKASPPFVTHEPEFIDGRVGYCPDVGIKSDMMYYKG